MGEAIRAQFVILLQLGIVIVHRIPARARYGNRQRFGREPG